MINKNIEYEKRMLLTVSEYNNILSFYQKFPCKNIFITNTYFDNIAKSLIPKGYLFRLRNSNDEEYEFTLKISDPKGYIEHNMPLDKNGFTSFNKEIIMNPFSISDSLFRELSAFNPLYRQCELKTERKEFKIDDYLLVLDHNFYNGVEDYNIEIETSSMEKAESIIKEICDKFNIKYEPHSPSKSTRALATITNIKEK